MYIKKEQSQVIAWNGPSLGKTKMIEDGWIFYEGSLPTSRLDIVDGEVVELPEPPLSEDQVALLTKDDLLLKSAMKVIPMEDDATALQLAPICPEWVADVHYTGGEIVNHNNVTYRVVQDVDALAEQPPGAEGMLAIYRPLNPEASGTLEDPIPFINGMDVYNGKYYSFNGKIYLAKADMIPCTWNPDTQGMWQWELVE